jgi:hypothetical protein
MTPSTPKTTKTTTGYLLAEEAPATRCTCYGPCRDSPRPAWARDSMTGATCSTSATGSPWLSREHALVHECARPQ